MDFEETDMPFGVSSLESLTLCILSGCGPLIILVIRSFSKEVVFGFTLVRSLGYLVSGSGSAKQYGFHLMESAFSPNRYWLVATRSFVSQSH